MNKALEQNYDGRIKMIRDILGVDFKGKTFNEKEAFVTQYKEQLGKVIKTTLDATYDLFTNQVNVYQVCECDAVAAKSLDEALDWYKSYTGLGDDDLYKYDAIETVNLDELVLSEEGSKELVTVRSILEEIWQGEPVIAVSTF